MFHLRVEHLVLEVVTASLKVGESKERALRDVARGCGHDVVLDGPTTAKHPHEVVEVIWGHRLVQSNSNLARDKFNKNKYINLKLKGTQQQLMTYEETKLNYTACISCSSTKK